MEVHYRHGKTDLKAEVAVTSPGLVYWSGGEWLERAEEQYRDRRRAITRWSSQEEPKF